MPDNSEPAAATTPTVANFLNLAYTRSIAADRRAYPQHTNRASSAGDPCARRLLWRRTRWSEAILPPVSMLRRFRAGNKIEDAVRQQLEKGGVVVLQNQRPLEWKHLELTGTIDGVVLCPDNAEAVLDIKSCSPFRSRRSRS